MNDIVFYFEHAHVCDREGVVEEVRPEIRNGLFTMPQPRCVEVPDQELRLVDKP